MFVSLIKLGQLAPINYNDDDDDVVVVIVVVAIVAMILDAINVRADGWVAGPE